MNIVRAAKILALSLAMFTSPALADYSLGKIPDTWYQLSTDSERTFCGAGAQFFNGVYLHIAYIAEIGEWVIVFGSESWQFQNGSRYDVTVLIDGMGSTIEAKAINEHAVMFRASKEFLHAFTALVEINETILVVRISTTTTRERAAVALEEGCGHGGRLPRPAAESTNLRKSSSRKHREGSHAQDSTPAPQRPLHAGLERPRAGKSQGPPG